MPLAGAITMMAGAMAMGAVIAPDVTRYARRDKDAFFSWFLGIWLMNTIIVGIGAALMLGSGQPNLPMAMLGIGLGAGALMIVILGQWTTNDNNLYSSALSFMNLVPWTKWKLTVVFGVIGTALAAAGAINYFVDYLTLLGTYVPAVGAVMLADYYIVRRYMDGIVDKKRYEFGEGAKYKMVNVPAIVCFIVGGYVGSKIPGITTVNAVLLTMAIYLLCVFACKKLHVPYQFGEAMEGKKGF
jgi:cytosine permease